MVNGTSYMIESSNAGIEAALRQHDAELLSQWNKEVHQLCKDFSSRNGSIYILDVDSALDGLTELMADDIEAGKAVL